MFWRLFVVGFVLNKRNNRYSFPNKMTEITTDEPLVPSDDDNNFLSKIIRVNHPSSLEEILVKKTGKKKKTFFNSGRDERYDILRDDMILNITLFNHQMKLLKKLESSQVSNVDKLEAITQYRKDIESGDYLLQLKKSGLMKDWDFPPIK